MPLSLLRRVGRLVAGLLMTSNLGSTPLPAQTFALVDAAVEAGISRGVYPGAVVIIGRRDSVLYARGYGSLTWGGGPPPSPDSTLWDLASVSKVVGTTSALMRLVDQGRVRLDAPVRHYLPRFRGGAKAKVTVRMLLDHTSGLAAYKEFYRMARTREQAIRLLYREPLRRPPGVRAEYSDLNALLLGLLVERVTGNALDEVVAREVTRPLGLAHTRYGIPDGWRARTAPSWVNGGTPVRGVVNDRNAQRFGPAAGHAGLFATGEDLSRYAQVWLRGGETPDGKRWVKENTMRRFLERRPESGTRRLGWDSPDLANPQPSVFGSLISASAYGHTGWTGTELWIDPDRDLYLIFLTNRSYEPRVANSIRELRLVRAALSDAALQLVPRVGCAQTLAQAC